VIRNGARFLARELRRLRVATASFERVHVLLVESDSSDTTLDVLEAASAEWPALRYLSEGSLRERLPQRTARIAHCRNVCLEELKSNPLYSEVTHVIVADLDRVCHDLTPSALASCWGPQAATDWAVCTANQGDWYYDLWALRHPVWCPGDVWQEHAQLMPLLGSTEATNVTQFARMVHIPPNRPWIEVHSAFGGLGVYRREALLGARYMGLDEAGREICEHVTLHEQIRAAGGRVFINPALINARSTKHGGRKGFWRTQRRKLWQWIRERTA
jgi:hypothetical protein